MASKGEEHVPIDLGDAFEYLQLIEHWADEVSATADEATTRARLHTLELSAPLGLFSHEVAPFVRKSGTPKVDENLLGGGRIKLSALILDPTTQEFGRPEDIVLGRHQRGLPLCGRYLFEDGQLTEPPLPIPTRVPLESEIDSPIVDNPDFNRPSGLRGWLHARGHHDIHVPVVELRGDSLATCDEPERYLVALSGIVRAAGVSRHNLRKTDAPHLVPPQETPLPWPAVPEYADLPASRYV